jgi:hypothetical protein
MKLSWPFAPVARERQDLTTSRKAGGAEDEDEIMFGSSVVGEREKTAFLLRLAAEGRLGQTLGAEALDGKEGAVELALE